MTPPALHIEVITLFPTLIEHPVSLGVVGKALEKKTISITTRDLRPYGLGKHRIVDDIPYGGGAGMVMRPEPLVQSIAHARDVVSKTLENQGKTTRAKVYTLDPQGTRFTQKIAAQLAQEGGFVLVCGRYEGMDERVRNHTDGALCVGDFILTGGEIAALCVIDATARLIPSVLGNDASAVVESFSDGLLEGAHYTRPAEFEGHGVPDILTSGHHGKIEQWRREQSLLRTLRYRPELLEKAPLSKEDRRFLQKNGWVPLA